MFKNDALCATNKKRYYRTNTNGIENNMSEYVNIVETGIRVVEIEVKTFKKLQRFCLKCGKILPTKLPQYYTHNCEKPDFIEWLGVNAVKTWLNLPELL